MKLNDIFNKSPRLILNDTSKIVIMSDCHRGSGGNSDNFEKNKNIFIAALTNYYNRGYTYIELGDGDDMWEVKDYEKIINSHYDVFKVLKKFHDNRKLIMIYGNHDICKKSKNILKKYFYKKGDAKLLNGLLAFESLVFKYKNEDVFMIHGHQVDLLNDTFWKLSRFLVRYIWRPLEKIGVKDPTKISKNYGVTKNTEKKLEKWSIENRKILIAGHTHRPTYPDIGKSLYFNDGTCIHPDGITCIEIEKGGISLVRWIRKDNILKREVIKGSYPIISFFVKLNNT